MLNSTDRCDETGCCLFKRGFVSNFNKFCCRIFDRYISLETQKNILHRLSSPRCDALGQELRSTQNRNDNNWKSERFCVADDIARNIHNDTLARTQRRYDITPNAVGEPMRAPMQSKFVLDLRATKLLNCHRVMHFGTCQSLPRDHATREYKLLIKLQGLFRICYQTVLAAT